MKLAAREQESRTLHMVFPAQGEHAAHVRQMLKAHLTMWGWLDVIDDTLLAADEVFVNAVEHGSSGETSTVSVEIDCATDRLRVAVNDSSRSLPTLKKARALDVGGRGLALVEAISDEWGADLAQDGRGKQVWFTLSHSSVP